MSLSVVTDPLMQVGKGRVAIYGKFFPAGTGAPTGATGQRWTVARAGAGDFTITFTDSFNELVCAVGTVQMSSATDIIVQFGDYTAASKTLTLRTVVAAVETDIAADANNSVSFLCIFRNTSYDY